MLGTFDYTYDGASGRLATVTYPNDQTSTYSYYGPTNDFRLQTIHHKYPNASTLSKFDYTYDTVGNILTWRQQADSDAVLWKYGYDAANQLSQAVKWDTETTPSILKRYAYGYDPAGNRTHEQIDDAITAASHDTLNRLTAHAAGGMLTFAGTLNEPATVTIQGRPATVDASNAFRGTAPTTGGANTVTIVATDASTNQTAQQYEVDVTGGAKTFTYDANGNMTSDGTRTFDWDARNQLVAVTIGTHRSEFSYDGQQRRVRILEKENSVTQSDMKVVWCGNQICEERASDGTTVTRRAFRDGEQILDAAHFFSTDHLGSVWAVTDASVASLAQYAFDPWGRRTVSAGTDATKVGFTGHLWHSAGQQWLVHYRAYDSGLGNWLSEDPLPPRSRAANELSGYGYTANRPISARDALGLCSCGDECPSGKWGVTYGSVTYGAGVGVDAGEGWIYCNETPTVRRRAKIGCVLIGAFAILGVSASGDVGKPTITGPCNRDELVATKTSGWVGMLVLFSLGISDGSVESFSVGLSRLGAGFAYADCIITPR